MLFFVRSLIRRASKRRVGGFLFFGCFCFIVSGVLLLSVLLIVVLLKKNCYCFLFVLDTFFVLFCFWLVGRLDFFSFFFFLYTFALSCASRLLLIFWFIAGV